MRPWVQYQKFFSIPSAAPEPGGTIFGAYMHPSRYSKVPIEANRKRLKLLTGAGALP